MKTLRMALKILLSFWRRKMLMEKLLSLLIKIALRSTYLIKSRRRSRRKRKGMIELIYLPLTILTK
jgi:hypothetical protein